MVCRRIIAFTSCRTPFIDSAFLLSIHCQLKYYFFYFRPHFLLKHTALFPVLLIFYASGINFENVRFRWDKFVDPIPGWEVSQFWLTEDGMAKKGVFNFTFYSGEGKLLKGCEPHTTMRRAMLSMVSRAE